MTDFYAYRVSETEKGFVGNVTELSTAELPDSEVLIRVKYSSLNYKDALSATGNKGVTRKYPHTPGIDACGVVERSKSDKFKEGDEVIVTSYDLGMNTPGGFGQYISVPADWIVPLPNRLGMEEAMFFGTAGLTAAAGVENIARDISCDSGEVLVTGATGGVGAIAVLLLAQRGYNVVASTGKLHDVDWLKSLGAQRVIHRDKLSTRNKSALLKGTWAAAYDTVGGPTLENVVKSTQNFGVISCCGNVASAELSLTVYPFILRGIKLMGISSQNLPMDKRIYCWNKIAGDWKPENTKPLQTVISLNDVSSSIEKILQGGIRGRVVIDLG